MVDIDSIVDLWDALASFFEGEAITSLFANSPEAYSQLFDNIYTNSELLSSELLSLDFSNLDADITSNENLLRDYSNLELDNIDGSDLENNESEKEDVPDEKEKTQKIETKNDAMANKIANATALAVSAIIKDVVINTVKAVHESFYNPLSEQPVTEQNDPIKREILGYLNSNAISKAEKANKAKRIFVLRKPVRKHLDYDAEHYMTEKVKDAVQLALPDNNRGNFQRLGYCRGLLLRYLFFTMQKHEKELDNLAFFTLDIPVPQSNGYNVLTRVRKYVGDDELRFYDISYGLDYAMEPMFPRLIFEDGNVKEIPDKWRRELQISLRKDKHMGHRKPYFTPREYRLMLSELEVYPFGYDLEKKSKKIRILMASDYWADEYPQDEIRKLWKQINEKSSTLFRVVFKPKSLVPHYWLEMGLYLEKK